MPFYFNTDNIIFLFSAEQSMFLAYPKIREKEYKKNWG